jgi:hypothetical protein
MIHTSYTPNPKSKGLLPETVALNNNQQSLNPNLYTPSLKIQTPNCTAG